MFEKLMYIEEGVDIASSIREMLEEDDLNLKAIVDLSAAKVLGDAWLGLVEAKRMAVIE